jgi:short subunit dehydrogenase-like uncharacterized protein
MPPAFDVVVFGATGFTGRLVAEYLNRAYPPGGPVAWAMAGRDPGKLEHVRGLVGAPATVPLLLADASDAASLAALVRQARVVIAAVGPYQVHGEPLVRACAEAGTDYVDLCGEPGWMARMIPLLEAPARASGARIVFSCGFDSIPFDLGVVFLQAEAVRRFGEPLRRVRGRVRVMKGRFSGGTMASGLATFAAMGRDPDLARVLADPFALTPGFRGPPQPEGESASYDEAAKSWTGPFVMAGINTKNIHRTNALLGHPWGRDFLYDERMLTGEGERGEKRARRLARRSRFQDALLRWSLTRELLRRFSLPKPGEGPSREERESGRYELLFIGDTPDGRRLAATVKGERDPGYGSTSRIIAEAAICLAREVDRTRTPGGVWTPGAALGLALLPRLGEKAGLQFAIED